MAHQIPRLPTSGLKCKEDKDIDTGLFYLAVLYRFALLLLVQTSFVPDEIFQYVEPAYAMATSGSPSIRTWEWEADHRIRSFVPLLPLAGAYKLLALMGLDTADNLRLLPRFLSTLLAVLSDWHFQRLCNTTFQSHTIRSDLRVLHHIGYTSHSIAASYALSHAQCAFILHLLSWSLSYCLPRTLGNSIETCLLIIGASLLFSPATAPIQWSDIVTGRVEARRGGSRSAPLQAAVPVSSTAITLAAISVYIRPTAVLIWAPLLLLKLATIPTPFTVLLKQMVPIGLAVAQGSVLLDSYHYGTLTVTPWRFYAANVVHGYAAYFGLQPWYWSVTQGLPTVLGVYLPLVAFGAYYSAKSAFLKILCAIAVLYAVGLNAISPHMEIRFLLPSLPFLHLLAGSTVRDVYIWSCNRKRSWPMSWGVRYLAVTVALVQLGAVVYLLRFHQCGAEAAMAAVGQDIRAHHLPTPCGSEDTSCSHHHVHIYLAAPCFAFSGYAGLHLPLRGHDAHRVTLHSAPCVLKMEPEMYFDHSPAHHLSALIDHDNEPSSATEAFTVDYVITFDSYLSALNDTLHTHSFAPFAILPHAYFKYDLDDPHPKKEVHIYKRQQLRMRVAYNPPEVDPIATGTATEVPEQGPDEAGEGTEEALSELPSGGEVPKRAHAPFKSFVAAGGTLKSLF